MPTRPRFRRPTWREVLGPAPERELSGYRLVAPDGVVAEQVEVATTPLHRARGLLGRRALDDGGCLLLAPCAQIHTLGMRFAIDVVFVDEELTVVAARTLSPGKLSRIVRRAWGCLELPEGTIQRAGIEPGIRLQLVEREAAEDGGE